MKADADTIRLMLSIQTVRSKLDISEAEAREPLVQVIKESRSILEVAIKNYLERMDQRVAK